MEPLRLSHLVVQNLRRKPYRAFVIGLCIAVASGSLFFATIVLSGVQTSLEVGQSRLGADLIVVPAGQEVAAQETFITGEATSFKMPADIEQQVADTPGVIATSPQIFIQTLTNASCCIGEFFLVGFDPATDFTISPWLANNLDGAALNDFDMIAGDRILLRAGDSGTFFGTAFTVIGVLEKTGMGIDRTIYIPIPGVRTMIQDSTAKAEQTLEISPDEISIVLVQTKPGENLIDVAEQIELRVEGIKVFTASKLNQSVNRQLQGITGTVVGITSVLWLMSMLTIGLVFSLIVNERKREFGLFRAMGARQSLIFRLVVSEAGLLTGVGGLAGLLFSSLLLISFSRLIQIRLNIPYLAPSLWQIGAIETGILLLSLLTGIVASLQPAYSSSKLEPYNAIRQGE